ncbi:hypothetical protein [Methanobacterium sp. BAmetb5]|uniref:hypothetical protein n=1 Tax=Methanobacterium sp. BAmetb5 TaxID=2025351 RepID=UPI000E978AB1|nr:hypothetical protein [Methanobacterium sp. BAmetb5]AXV40393.1 MAG: hypothetical protein CIT02_08705 [Methanobacterium sp. BAmetb5]
MNYSFDILQRKVISSINKLMDFDSCLLNENANERSITHKLAEYLQQEFKEWNVDCEYNRMVNGDSQDPKRMRFPVEDTKSDDTDAKTVFPDIIIHQRNERKNLLVIEVKKKFRNRINMEFDQRKLKTFTSDQFEYSFGLHIIFYVKSNFKKPPLYHWYENGELMEI